MSETFYFIIDLSPLYYCIRSPFQSLGLVIVRISLLKRMLLPNCTARATCWHDEQKSKVDWKNRAAIPILTLAAGGRKLRRDHKLIYVKASYGTIDSRLPFNRVTIRQRRSFQNTGKK